VRAATDVPAREPPIAFGPIPSRRLGRSLGINNIPPKVCSYGCVYCQVGPTTSREIERRRFSPPEVVVAAVTDHVARVRARGERIDYLTFAPDGEPTLDESLQAEIEGLRPLDIPIAVFTNGSLAWMPDVREALRAADWVSVKVDAVQEEIWRAVDRPHPRLELATILDGIRRLATGFPETLVGETMLVSDLNDGADSVAGVGRFFASAGISTVYILVPTRPPTFPWATPPSESVVVRAHRIMSELVPGVECVIGAEPDDFGATGEAAGDLLRIAAVHPMRRSSVEALLEKDGADWAVAEDLLRRGLLTETEYRGERFYLRRISR
jgi:wyosine [tRNA(Phe)-imidazoG37] synthetase (radical SAM superfamily)